ncbi:hypothetical protein [Aquibacillus salsiterrae]|uniref:Uncharacterized protein n=1 Tax=Aquibacillus salsiterrae TaxID=2950439 RepID=A0A9X3WFU6_9BACI|nr:hypothetical protein [Aquibacillus salsiterrae]MDC3416669.1 hypothetical protein [Aquibacillus salsiterrae]
MKKIFIILTVFTLITVAIPSSVFASGGIQYGAGEWDLLYEGGLYLTTDSYEEIQVSSGGGNLEICVFDMSPSNNGNFIVEEQDPSGRDFVAYGYIYPDSSGQDCVVLTDLNSYVDGDNNKAEFVIGFDVNGFNETVTVRIRD